MPVAIRERDDYADPEPWRGPSLCACGVWILEVKDVYEHDLDGKPVCWKCWVGAEGR